MDTLKLEEIEWLSDSSRSSDAERTHRPRSEKTTTRSSIFRDFRAWRYFNDGYQRLPTFVDPTQAIQFRFATPRWATRNERLHFRCRMSPMRWISAVVTSVVLLAFLISSIHHARRPTRHEDPPRPPSPWLQFHRLDGYYNGIRTLVSPSEYIPSNRYNQSVPHPIINATLTNKLPAKPAFEPVLYNPYPDYSSHEYLADHEEVHDCFVDKAEEIAAPDIYAYPALPRDMPVPFYGSYSTLGLEENVCFERYGRLGPYGYGYNSTPSDDYPGAHSESQGSAEILAKTGQIDYSNVDWADAQQRCYKKNEKRFAKDSGNRTSTAIARHAYVLRTWTGYEYTDLQILSLRAMINELSLKSGGEYDVHLLVHVKDTSIPIWADRETYRATIEANVPREFWNISTLWSEQQMESYYPNPFPNNFANMAGQSIHGVYRSAHFPLQWFSQQHPEYDYVWNWEMDMRYIGHYYEFNTRIGEWAKAQPRKGMWERSRRFYIPELHGTWQNFTDLVERETFESDVTKNNVTISGPLPIWGPVQDFRNDGMLAPPVESKPPADWQDDDYKWGVGEEADLLVFNPIFDPALTNWVFRDDVTGYNNTIPIPPRRTAIITVARLSKRLLNIMHEETWKMKHTMFPEMFPPSVAMHHGLKALYVPHPVYFDRDWNLEHMDQVFNHPVNATESPFGWGEHNMQGSSFYYNSGFSGALWRRWLGLRDNHEGGQEDEEKGTGRMCLRSTLHHPVKFERSE